MYDVIGGEITGQNTFEPSYLRLKHSAHRPPTGYDT